MTSLSVARKREEHSRALSGIKIRNSQPDPHPIKNANTKISLLPQNHHGITEPAHCAATFVSEAYCTSCSIIIFP
jgi:hypothetical protein